MEESIMKKLLALTLALLLVISLCACGGGEYTVTTNDAEYDGLLSVPGRDCLYYDPATKIVYYITTAKAGLAQTSSGYGFMSPYYAPNGLPYLYNAETNSLVEIQN